VDELKTRLIDE